MFRRVYGLHYFPLAGKRRRKDRGQHSGKENPQHTTRFSNIGRVNRARSEGEEERNIIVLSSKQQGEGEGVALV